MHHQGIVTYALNVRQVSRGCLLVHGPWRGDQIGCCTCPKGTYQSTLHFFAHFEQKVSQTLLNVGSNAPVPNNHALHTSTHQHITHNLTDLVIDYHQSKI